MNIIVVGAGYVGLVTSSCLADLGNYVICIDIDTHKINSLQRGILPIYEPGLESMVLTNMRNGRLHFSSVFSDLFFAPQIILITVGTPSEHDGSVNIRYVLDVAHSISACITENCVIVDKSTVPVGMAYRVQCIIQQELKKSRLSIPFHMVSNPEFLREGAAIEDFMQPDRIIVGLESHNNYAKQVMMDLYFPILRRPEKIYFMSIKEAEMTKYVANAMLATRISFMNEMAILCERMDVDIDNVRVGIGSDSRIGEAFLNAGCGYGGSCFPKDVRALAKMAEQYGIEPMLLRAVDQRNNQQKLILQEKIEIVLGKTLSGKVVSIWGLAFKPGTDDMREAASLVLIKYLVQQGAYVQAYDPVATSMAKKILPMEWIQAKKVTLFDDQYQALKNADVLVLVTEWKEFSYPNIEKMKRLMQHFVIIDGRNQYDPRQMRELGFTYIGVGRGCMHQYEKAPEI